MAPKLKPEQVQAILTLRFVARMTYQGIAKMVPPVSDKTVYRVCTGKTHAAELEDFRAKQGVSNGVG